MIRLGVCRPIEDAEVAYKAGYDYIEGGFGSIMSLSDADFKEWMRKVNDAPLKVEAMNGMLPGKFRLTGPEADLKPVEEFLKLGFDRAQEFGLQVVVFGSGAARNIPLDADGKLVCSVETALSQVEEYLHMAGDLAQAAGVTIAIEPLRAKESNIINLVAQGAELARRVKHPAIKLLADGYHMAEMNESADSIIAAGNDLMRHCHTANPAGRVYPTPDDAWDYKPFFDALKTIGYDGRVSVEAGCDDFAKASVLAFSALDPLRK